MFEMPRFLLELLVVGLAIVIIGIPISYIGMKMSGEKKLPSTGVWISIGISLFIIGAMTHIIFEAIGFNREYVKYYCK